MQLPPEVQQWIVAAVILLLVAGLVREIWRPSLVFFLALTVLTVSGILTPEDMLSGFANTQIATVVLLLVIGNVINQTTVIPALFDRVFKNTATYPRFLSRMMLTVGSFSAFMNNTPLVAMLIPYVYNWGKRNKISPSKLLIPLSYATIGGGMITVIGTSTNLIVNGLLEDEGLRRFSMFEFAPIGIPALLLVWLYMMTVGRRILPDHKDPLQAVKEETVPYLLEVEVDEKSPLVGKPLKETAVQFFQGLYVVARMEDGKPVSPVNPRRHLAAGDRLIIKGGSERIGSLLASGAGLHVPEVKKYDPAEGLDLVEIVVSYNSSLAHKRVSATNFRSLYDASIVAVHHKDANILDAVGEVVIHPGDVLMVLAKPESLKRMAGTTDFYIVSKEPQELRVGGWKAWVAGLSFGAAILLNTFEVVELFTVAVVLLCLFFFLRVTNFRELRRSTDADLVIVLALSIGLGKAIKNTGVAQVFADTLNAWFGAYGLLGALVGIYLVSNVLTQLVSNAAAAAIMFPIAVVTAQTYGVDYAAFVMAVAFAASLDFSTPIGYQTNLMVYGPGGYKFTDYLKVGIPLNLMLMALVVGLIYMIYRVG